MDPVRRFTTIHSWFRHIDSAQVYKNENAVGEAVKDGGIPREELFISGFLLPFQILHDLSLTLRTRSNEMQ